MLNEVQEIRDYTKRPGHYLGRFTLESIRDFLGFERELVPEQIERNVLEVEQDA